MMDPKVLAIPLAFILLAVLLCWHLIASRGRWGVKLFLIATVPSFGLAVWASIASYRGYPTTEDPPEKAQLLWAEVREGNQRSQNPGRIFLWLVPLVDAPGRPLPFDYAHEDGEPRAYRVPYTRQMHELVEQTRSALADGRPVILTRKKGEAGQEGDARGGNGGVPGENAEGGDENAGGQGQSGYGQSRQEYQLYELPAPTPPRKDE